MTFVLMMLMPTMIDRIPVRKTMDSRLTTSLKRMFDRRSRLIIAGARPISARSSSRSTGLVRNSFVPGRKLSPGSMREPGVGDLVDGRQDDDGDVPELPVARRLPAAADLVGDLEAGRVGLHHDVEDDEVGPLGEERPGARRPRCRRRRRRSRCPGGPGPGSRRGPGRRRRSGSSWPWSLNPSTARR